MKGRDLLDEPIEFRVRNGRAYFARGKNGNSSQSFAFNRTRLPEAWCSPVANAFVQINTPRRPGTRTQAFYRLGYLAKFLNREAIASPSQFGDSEFVAFIRFCEALPKSMRTRDGVFNESRSLLAWMQDYEICEFKNRIRTRRGLKKQRTFHIPKVIIPASEIKRILIECYKAIEQIEERIESRGKFIEASRSHTIREEFGELYQPDRNELIKEVLAHGEGELPKANSLPIPLIRKMQQLGMGLTELRCQLELTGPDLMPFYVALLIQTVGNPLSIWNLRRDCIEQCGTNKETIFWEKARASREQCKTFDPRVKWAAPNIIRRLKNLQEYFQSQVSADFRNRLFVCQLKSRVYATPSDAHLYNLWPRFSERLGIDGVELRRFRASIASEIDSKAGVEAATKALQHGEMRTTQRYLNNQAQMARHNSTIRHFQGEIVKWSAEDEARSFGRGFETLFGTHCKDPYAGIAEGQKKGRLCTNFLGCFFCPGAIIPKNNVYIATRVEQAKRHLEQTKRRMMLSPEGARRFRNVYQELLNVICHDVQPKLSVGYSDALLRDLAPLPELY